MIPAFYSAQALARRAVPWCSAPRGTPSRLLKVRLDRNFHRNGPCQSSRPASPQPSASDLESSSSSSFSATTDNKPQPLLDSDALNFLNQVLQAQLPKSPPTYTERQDVEISKKSDALIDAEVEDEPAGFQRAPARLTAALKSPSATTVMLRKMVAAGINKTDANNPYALANLPPMVFSELLRSLDPIEVISKELDPAAGIHIGPGMAERTPLGELVDVFGVRKIHYLLFRRILAAVQLRLDAGHRLLLSDYTVLLRLAGASSDPGGAQSVWLQVLSQEPQLAANSDLYSEFLKARYLTDPLYVQHDLTRLRVRPVNLWKAKNHLKRVMTPAIRWKLRNSTRGKLLKQTLRHGQNRYKPEIAEHLTRALRTGGPIGKAYGSILKGIYAPSESTLCPILIGLGRGASLHHIQDLLARFWHISVVRLPSGEVAVREKKSTDAPRRSSPLYPTEQLLHAVVEAFCTQGELQTALKVVDYISRHYGVAVPAEIWRQLLEWSYIMCHGSMKSEWKLLRLPNKTTRPATVQSIWNVMTVPPYNVEPSLKEHGLLIKSLILNAKYREAMAHMAELLPYYKSVLAHLEDAFRTYVTMCQLGATRDEARREWLASRAHKDETWYYFQRWIQLLFKRVRPDYELGTQLIPNLIDAFRSVMPSKVKYRIRTGTVEIHAVNPVMRFRLGGEIERAAWVTGDIVGPRRENVDGDVSPAFESLPYPGPKLSFEERLKKRPLAKTRRPIRVNVNPDTFLESKLDLGTIRRQFT